jgi:Ca2+-binding RTX toxin-like protein
MVWKWVDIAQKVLQGTEGDDSLQGYDDKHAHLFGLGGNDAIYGANLADTLDGGVGNDTLSAQGGNDVLLGGDGDDTLDGGIGDDVLNGGKGNDGLYGGSDSDTYLFAAGDGLDSLYDAGGIADRIKFTDITSAQVKVSRVANGDLLLAYGTQSLLTVTSYFHTANGSIEQFRLSDGVVWKWVDIAQKVLQGTEGNDYLQGYYDKHAHLLGLGGNDVIYGANLADTLDGGAGNDTLSAGGGNDVLLGGDGDDALDGGIGGDVFNGGKGNDRLYGGYGDNDSDTYLFAAGDGFDSLQDFHGIADKVKFTSAVVTDAALSRDTHSNLWFDFGNGDRIMIAGYFVADNFHIEQFKFTDALVGEVFIGKLPGEALVGNADNNILVASAGSESLAGGAGDDWYRLNDSGDTVTEAADAGNDTVISSVSYTLSANVENLVLKGTAQVGSGNPLDNRVDGNAADNTLNGGSGNDVLSGKHGNDLLSGGEGADVLSGGLGQDIFFLAETAAATDTVKIAATDSLATGFDTVTRFGLGDGISTAGADRLGLGTVNIAADVAAADGVNVGSLKSHSISNGLVSFGNTDSYTGAVSLASVGTALDYLQANLTGGITVAFTALGSTYLFQDGGDTDIVVQLLGVEAANLNTTGLVAGGVWLV